MSDDYTTRDRIRAIEAEHGLKPGEALERLDELKANLDEINSRTFDLIPEVTFEEKMRSINFGGIKRGSEPKQSDDPDFKRKLDRDLNEMVNDGRISQATADGQAGIAGLCESQGDQKQPRRDI